MHLALAALNYSTDHERCHALLSRALDLCRDAGDLARAAWALVDLGQLASEAGDIAEAERLLAEAIEAARAAGDRWIETLANDRRGALAFRHGRFREARDLIERNVAFWRDERNWHDLAWALAEVGFAEVMSGDVEGSRPRFEEAFALATSSGHRRLEGWIRCARATASYVLGDRAAARIDYVHAAELFGSIDDSLNAPWPHSCLSQLEILDGDLLGSAAALATAARLQESLGAYGSWRSVCRFSALLAMAADEPTLAARCLGWLDGSSELDEAPAPWHEHDKAWVTTTAEARLGPADYAAARAEGATADVRSLVAAVCVELRPPARPVHLLPPWAAVEERWPAVTP